MSIAKIATLSLGLLAGGLFSEADAGNCGSNANPRPCMAVVQHIISIPGAEAKLGAILDDETLHDRFIAFELPKLRPRFQEESLEFLRDVALLAPAVVFANYIRVGADKVINIDSDLRDQLTAKAGTNSLTLADFQGARAAIITLLASQDGFSADLDAFLKAMLQIATQKRFRR